MNQTKAIGVLDSGVGGVSVLKELISLMPNENYIYLADSLNAPYGEKSMERVREITLKNTEFLLSKGAKAIVIACNTATGASASAIREKYPSVPIIGLEPAVKPASCGLGNDTVLVMATELTLKQPNFQKLLERFSNFANIIPLPCPGLMEIVEDGDLEGDRIDNYLKELFKTIDKSKIDSVVLGCTHYPHVKKSILKALGRDIEVYDGGYGAAKETKRRLEEACIIADANQKGTVQFINTSDDERKNLLALKLLKGN